MAVNMDKTWLRKSLAIGILPFAALGVAGCDNAAEEPAAEEEAAVEEEAVEE